MIDPWFRVGRAIRPDDGVMDICVFAPPGPVGIMSMALWFLAGSVNRSRHFHQYPAHEVWLSATPTAPIEIDGDYAGHGDLHLQLRPGALAVVVPGIPPRNSNIGWLPGTGGPAGVRDSTPQWPNPSGPVSRLVLGQ